MNKYPYGDWKPRDDKWWKDFCDKRNGPEAITKEGVWVKATGYLKCPACGEDYNYKRRLSRSRFTEYDHGTWVCKYSKLGK